MGESSYDNRVTIIFSDLAPYGWKGDDLRNVTEIIYEGELVSFYGYEHNRTYTYRTKWITKFSVFPDIEIAEEFSRQIRK